MSAKIKVDEFGDELPGGLQGTEPFREHRRVLQRLVPRLAKRVVVGNPWPGMGSGHTKIIEQGRDGLTGHRRPTIGVHHLRDALDAEDLGHQINSQQSGLGVVHVRTDDVPGVDVDHHVAVVIQTTVRAGELRNIPAVHLPGGGGLQFRDCPCRVGRLPAPVLDLPVSFQHPVHRGNRTQIRALGQQGRVDLRWRLVHEPLRVQHRHQLSRFGVGQLVHRDRPTRRLGRGLHRATAPPVLGCLRQSQQRRGIPGPHPRRQQVVVTAGQRCRGLFSVSALSERSSKRA